MARQAKSVQEVVENGLCIGCGLCEALAPERWTMRMNRHGRLRPLPVQHAPASADAEILAGCPGVVARAEGRGDKNDSIWGSFVHMGSAWAGDADIRFRAATGGVLTALSVHLLRSGKADFVLHCAADQQRPMRSKWVISDTPEEVAARSGSRYGPSDTLAGLETALARGQPFAIIGKPCDAGAVRARAKADARLNELLVAVLVMVCGGASDLGKSQAVLDELGLEEDDLTLFRYRGHGNPGPTRIETLDGQSFEKTYQQMWADEAGWRIQTRCKLCPDAIGEAADVVAADIWPGAEPEGEDEGFNGVIVRSPEGRALFEAAVAAGDLVRGVDHGPRDYDVFQPHQVDRKRAMAARLRGLEAAGRPVYAHSGLRLDELDAKDAVEEAGAYRRAMSGRFDDEVPGQ